MARTTAHVYDLIHDGVRKDYASEASTLNQIVRERNPGAATLLDVACGTGRHLGHLRDHYDVVGLDVDARMLEQARNRLPHVRLVEGDMRSFQLDRRFDAVTCLFSSIGYMSSTDELRAAVSCMARHLTVGGVLIVDGWIRPDAWIEPGTVHALSTTREGIAVARAGRSWRDGKKTFLDLHYLVAAEDGITYLVDHLELTLFTDEEYQDAFLGSGLRAEKADSGMPGRDRYIGVSPLA